MKVTLSRAITAHGEELTELDLREPTGEEVMAIGYPYLVVIGEDDTQGIELRPKIVGRYVSKLAGIPPSSLNTLSAGDISKLTAAVMGFFGIEAA